MRAKVISLNDYRDQGPVISSPGMNSQIQEEIRLLAQRIPLSELAFFPDVFRLVSIRSTLTESWLVRHEATLCHDPYAYRFWWYAIASQEEELPIDSLVRLELEQVQSDECEQLALLSRVVRVADADPCINLFWTVPHDWVQERQLVEECAEYWEMMPTAAQRAFNEKYWDTKFFLRYLIGPNSSGPDADFSAGLKNRLTEVRAAIDLATSALDLRKRNMVAAALMKDE